MKTLINRLREPSTYAGLAVLLSLAGVPGGELLGLSLSQFGAGVAGLLAIFVPEVK